MNKDTKVLIQLSEHLNLYSEVIIDKVWKNWKTALMNTSPHVCKTSHKMPRYYTSTVVKTVHTYSVHV